MKAFSLLLLFWGIFYSVTLSVFAIDDPFTIQNGAVFFDGERVEELDVNSFEKIHPNFVKDAKSVYGISYKGSRNNGQLHKLTDADPETFQVQGEDFYDCFAWDSNSAYIKDCHEYGEILTLLEVDGDTFTPLEENFSKDKNSVFYWDQKIQNADPETFEILAYKSESHYAKDKSQVYFYENSSRELQIVNADAATFEVIDWYYGKDKNHVYLNGVVIEGSDAMTLNKNGDLYFDAGGIYINGMIFTEFDPEKVSRKLRGLNMYFEDVVDVGTVYITDTESIFLLTEDNVFQKLEGVSPEELENNTIYLQGADTVYCRDKKLENIDMDSFENLNRLYTKDSDSVIFSWYAKDANSVFFNCEVIPGADPESFEILKNTFYGRDKTGFYFRDKRFQADFDPQKTLRSWLGYWHNDDILIHRDRVIEGLDMANTYVLDTLGESYAIGAGILVEAQDGVFAVHKGRKFPLQPTFKDIEFSKYRPAVEVLVEQGVINGYPDNTYRPEQKVNRAEFLKIVLEASDHEVGNRNDCFPDVGTEWFARYVCFAEDNDFINGYPDGNFKPAENINYVEALRILYEINKDAGLEDPIGNEWFSVYLEDALQNNIALNKAENDHLLTREEIAEIMVRYMENK